MPTAQEDVAALETLTWIMWNTQPILVSRGVVDTLDFLLIICVFEHSEYVVSSCGWSSSPTYVVGQNTGHKTATEICKEKKMWFWWN